jgi:putative ABC transport system substrate-binding protein
MLNDVHSVQNIVAETERAAQRLGVELQRLDVHTAVDFTERFEAAKRGQAQAIDVLPSAFFNSHRARIVELAAKHRIPTIYAHRDYVDAGGFMAYGPNLLDLARRAATYVDKILKGVKPGDLPIEQPTKFELLINVKTAKALGLTIPQPLLLRADQVLE